MLYNNWLKENILLLLFFEGRNAESNKRLSSRSGNKKIPTNGYLIDVYTSYVFF